MNEDIIKLAREAGWPDSLVAPVIMAKLAEFAALVRADEREALSKVTDEMMLAADKAMYGKIVQGEARLEVLRLGLEAALKARSQ